jgi:hypothetical protein
MYKQASNTIKTYLKEAQERKRSWAFPAAMLGGVLGLNALVAYKMAYGDRGDHPMRDYWWGAPIIEFRPKHPTIWDEAKRYVDRGTSAIHDMLGSYDKINMKIPDSWKPLVDSVSLKNDSELQRQQNMLFSAAEAAIDTLRQATGMAAGIPIPR